MKQRSTRVLPLLALIGTLPGCRHLGPRPAVAQEGAAHPERALVFTVEAWDVNCPQHITPRYTVEELSAVTTGGENRVGRV